MKKRFLAVLTMGVLSAAMLIGCATVKIENNLAPKVEEVVEEVKEEITEVTEIPEEKEDNTGDEAADYDLTGVYQYSYTEEIEGEESKFFSYLILNSDGTGYWSVQDLVPIEWNNDEVIVLGESHKFDYDEEEYRIILHEEFGDENYDYLVGSDPIEFVQFMNEPEYMWSYETTFYSSFVEERAEKNWFKSYDEVISYLEPGEGYAYAKVIGYPEDVLLFSDTIKEVDGQPVANQAFIYAMVNDRVVYVSVSYCTIEDNVVRIADGLLYTREENQVETDFFTEDGAGVMVKDYLYVNENEDGTVSYAGFKRETNSFDEDNMSEDITEKDYNDLVAAYESAEPVVFTVIE